MGLAIGQQPISLGVNYQAIRVPTLLVSGTRDLMSPPSVSLRALNDQTANPDKRLVSVENATHRTFDSNYCDEMSAAGRIAQADLTRAVLDKNTFDRIVTSPNSGWGTDYCTFASFAGIEALTRTATTSPALPNGFTPTATNVPATGLDTDTVKEQMAAMAIEFFRAKLARASSGTVGGTVPATLALTLGGPASLGAFVPGVDRTYDGSTTATVTSTAGSATLSIADPGREPGAAGQRHDPPRRGSAGARGHRGLRGAERQPADPEHLRRTCEQRHGDDRLPPAHRRQPGAADRQLRQDADLHAGDGEPVMSSTAAAVHEKSPAPRPSPVVGSKYSRMPERATRSSVA